MSKSLPYLLLILVIPLFLSFSSCKREADAFLVVPVTDYYPLQPGRYIVYRLDSTVFTNFETTKEVHSYQVKDIVDDQITDNQGRPAFRVRRMIRDVDGTQPWRDLITFLVTPLPNAVEYVENNLRFIKLTSPVRENYFWQGNSYIHADGDLDYMKSWEYNYVNVGQPYLVGDKTVENTVTVLQSDEKIGDPVLYPNNLASVNYSVEVYGKDIGLIYKDFMYWLYQKNNTLGNCRVVVAGQPDTPCPYDEDCNVLAQNLGGYMKCDTIASRYSYNGYGIKLKMLEHN